MTGPRYLLIGAAGLIGSHLRVALEGRDVVATSRRPIAGTVPLDILDGTATLDLIRRVRPTLILLAAAEPWVERCEREPEATWLVNVGGTRTVSEAARENGAGLVVFSSEYVFDGRQGDHREDDPVAPLNEYGKQKVEIEALARSVDPHLVCRTSGVFGREPSRKNFVLQLVDALRADRTFTVPSDQIITPSDADSLARAVVELLDRGAHGTFHIAGPEQILRPAFAYRIAHAFGLDETLIRPAPTSALGLRARRPLSAGLRDDKLREVLGHGLADLDDALNSFAASEKA